MGDLFDGYGSTPAPRKTASGVPPFDEMFEAPEHAADGGASREAYRELHQALARLTQEELRGRSESLASSYLAQGVTFDFAGEELTSAVLNGRPLDLAAWSRARIPLTGLQADNVKTD